MTFATTTPPATTFARVAAAWATATLLALAGCATESAPHTVQQLGTSARALMAAQRVDPNASQQHADRRAPTDARSLRAAMDRHGESFKSPPPATVVPAATAGR